MTVDPTEAERFLAACRAHHDVDPEAWHRDMLKPPPPRTPRCEFCGVLWADLAAQREDT